MLLLPHVRKHNGMQLNHNNQPRRKARTTMKIALLLLPSEPTQPSPSNGFDAPPAKSRRKRNHAHTAARRADQLMNEMTVEEFDERCKANARAEIIKTLKMAQGLGL